MFYRQRCIGCGTCVDFCRKDARSPVDLTKCLSCEEKEICAEVCPAQALQVCGKRMTAQQVLFEVLRDRACYGEEGGMTCSGGEPLLRTDFLEELLPLCRKEGISVCMDTTLNVDWEKVEGVLPWTDRFLVDIKFMNEKNHIQYTGRDGRKTVENLIRLSEYDRPVILRMPLIAGLNDTEEEIAARRKLLERLHNVERIDCFAVTDHAAGKYRALQRNIERFSRDKDPETLAREMKRRLEEKL